MVLFVLCSTFFVSVLALIYMFVAARWVMKQERGTAKMSGIADRIMVGATSFLRTEYMYIGLVVLVGSGLLWVLDWSDTGVSFFRVINYIVGASFSALAGVVGMRIATLANVRTAQAARRSLAKAFQISFVGGTIMGVGVVTFALLGMSLLFFGSMYVICERIDLENISFSQGQIRTILEVLTGFALGAETIALFARVAGGIYTKAADVGADIVGKIEIGIPEDDPRNPATIADNVGDNVGDIAGMGADLFGSYVSTLLAAMVLGVEVHINNNTLLSAIMLPLAIGSAGVMISLLASFTMRLRHEKSSVQRTLNMGNLLAVVAMAMVMYGLIYCMLPEEFICVNQVVTQLKLYIATVVGLVVGLVVSYVTEYFTTAGRRPVNFIMRQSATGPATNLISGLSVGMFSTAIPMLLFAVTIYGVYAFSNFYGVALAAVSMMSTTAMQLAIDGFGPIADNAGGIAEMSDLPKEVRERTDCLDAVGNTTASTGKGFAIASAALTSLGLFAAFAVSTGAKMVNLCNAHVLAGLFLGAMVPFLFSGLLISAVGRAAMKMVNEVRRQFRTIPGLMEGEAYPDYDACIAIATHAAIQQMVLPGILVLSSPVLVGICCGAEVLTAFLAGVVVVGTAMALFQCNAGGAWDNAKKAFEKGAMIDGEVMGKGSVAHTASVVGDTVGDPFKDTSGPAMNILIKLTIVVSLIVAPFLK